MEDAPKELNVKAYNDHQGTRSIKQIIG